MHDKNEINRYEQVLCGMAKHLMERDGCEECRLFSNSDKADSPTHVWGAAARFVDDEHAHEAWKGIFRGGILSSMPRALVDLHEGLTVWHSRNTVLAYFEEGNKGYPHDV